MKRRGAINNAGVFTADRSRTEDDPEMTMGVNVFVPFLLTRLLIPHFKNGIGPARVVNVVSDAYLMGRLNLNDLPHTGLTGIKAYAASKYALILFTLELAGRMKDLSNPFLPFIRDMLPPGCGYSMPGTRP